MNSARPQFPIWIFIATDLALLGAAAVIALQAPRPFSESTILWIVACVLLGVVVGLVPIIWHFERKKNEALDERQQALEALARTIASSAEQISIATGGLHDIADLAQRNLRQADQLPHRLQEKIAEFQAQLAQTNDVEKEELERELLALRTSESERLDVVSERIAKATAEWARLETATAQHLVAVNEGVSRLAQGTADATGKADSAAEQALAQTRNETARLLTDASLQAVKAIEAARTAALDNITERLSTLLARVAHDAATQVAARVASCTALLEAQLTRLEAHQSTGIVPNPVAAPRKSASDPDITTSPAVEMDSTVVAAPEPDLASAPETSGDGKPPAGAPPAITGESAPAQPPVPPSKRPRKSRREDAPPIAPGTVAASITPSEPALNSPAAESLNGNEQPPESSPSVEPSRPSAPAPEITSTAASDNQEKVGVAPSPPLVKEVPPASTAGAPSASIGPEPAASTLPSRKRNGKKPGDDTTPSLDLGLSEEDFSEANRHAMRGIMERVLTSDGATRLVVTAYIGIGNRLFIRGDGPGLSWERGVPLEFVSIGKWRWQTNEATQPVQFKIYKNDELECGSLGQQAVEPGYQQEVTAAF